MLFQGSQSCNTSSSATTNSESKGFAAAAVHDLLKHTFSEQSLRHCHCFCICGPHVFQQLFSSCLRSLAVAGGDSGAAGVYACLAGLGEHQRRGVTHPYHKGCRGTEQSVREVSWNIPNYFVLSRFPRMSITLPSFQIFNMFKPTFVSICKKSMRTLRLKLVETRG